MNSDFKDPIYQETPIKSSYLRPADLRYCYYYVTEDPVRRREVLGIGLHIDEALRLGAIELDQIKDVADNWIFTSPVVIDGKMSLAVDDDTVIPPGIEPTVADVQFKFGHHAWSEIDVSSTIPVKVYDDQSSGAYYKRVLKILEKGDDSVDYTGITSFNYDQYDTEGNSDYEGELDYSGLGLQAPSSDEGGQPQVLTESDAKSLLIKKFKDLADQADDEMVSIKSHLRTMQRSLSNLAGKMDKQLLIRDLGINDELHARLEFSELINSRADPMDWESFLAPLTEVVESPRSQERNRKQLMKAVGHRPVVHLMSYCDYDLYYISDVERMKIELGMSGDTSRLQSRNASFVNEPYRWVFIPRYGMVLNTSTMMMEWRIIDFNVRDMDSSTSQTGMKYRVWYPYRKIKSKSDELFSQYEECKPLMIYAGKKAREEFEYQYTSETQLQAAGVDRRYRGRVLMMEGELNAMLSAVLNPSTIVVATGTSRLPPLMHDKFMRNVSPLASLGVMYDDKIKTDHVIKSLKLQLDDSPKSCPTVTKYLATESNLPDAILDVDMDYENVIQAYLVQSKPKARRSLISELSGNDPLTAGDESNLRNLINGLKSVDTSKYVEAVRASETQMSDYELNIQRLPEAQYSAIDQKEKVRRIVEAVVAGRSIDLENQAANDLEIGATKQQESVMDRQLKELSKEIFEFEKVPELSKEERERLKERCLTEATSSGAIRHLKKSKVGGSEVDDSEIASGEEIRYFITPEDVSRDDGLLRYYESNAPRFKSIIYRNIMSREAMSELREKENMYLKLREDLQEKLVHRLKLSYGFNPSQEIVREMGLTLEPGTKAGNGKHIALAQGASGGKTTGLMAAVVQYYGEVCDAVESLDIKQIRRDVSAAIKAASLLLGDAFSQPTADILSLKYSDCSKEGVRREYWKARLNAPEDVQETLETHDLDSILIDRIYDMRDPNSVQIGADGMVIGDWLADKEGAEEFARHISKGSDAQVRIVSAAGKVQGGDAERFEKAAESIVKIARHLPADIAKVIQSSRSDTDADSKLRYRKMERTVAPMDMLKRMREVRDLLPDLLGRLNSAASDDLMRELTRASELYAEVASRGMVISTKSKHEVDHYYFILRVVHGIDADFVRRFHTESTDGESLGSDDANLVATPLVICTHKRIERPTNLFQYWDGEQMFNRRIVVIDEAFDAGRVMMAEVEDMIRLDLYLLNGQLCDLCMNETDLDKKIEDFKLRLEGWVESRKLDAIPEGATLLKMLLQPHYPALRFGTMTHTQKAEFFREMNQVQIQAMQETLEIIVVGMYTLMYDYFQTGLEGLQDDYQKLLDAVDDDSNLKDQVEDITPFMNYMTDIKKYWDEYQSRKAGGLDVDSMENPTRDSTPDDVRSALSVQLIYELQRTSGVEDDDKKLLKIPNPVSRQLRSASTLLLDATSLMVLHSPNAEGAVAKVLEELALVGLVWQEAIDTASSSEHPPEIKEIDNLAKPYRDKQFNSLTKALKDNHITESLYNSLSMLLVNSVITRADLEGIYTRPTPDPMLQSTRFGKFVWNGGWLGYKHDPRNPFDLEWTVLKIAGPPLTLHSWKSFTLPVSRISKNVAKLNVGEDELEVSRGTISSDIISELVKLLDSDFCGELVREVVGSDPELLEVYFKMRYVSDLQDWLLQNSSYFIEKGIGISVPRSIHDVEITEYDKDSYDHHGTKSETEFEDLSAEGEEDGLMIRVPKEVRIEYNSHVRSTCRKFEIDPKVTRSDVTFDIPKAMETLLDLGKSLAVEETRLQMKMRFLMTAISLNLIGDMVVEYLTKPDIIASRQKCDNGSWEEITTKRALNVFVWRRLNYSISGILTPDTVGYFPTISGIINEASDAMSMKDSIRDKLEELNTVVDEAVLGEAVGHAALEAKARAVSSIKNSDYVDYISSELRPMPELIVGRVIAKLEKMEETERVLELKENLDDYLMVTHHGSSSCKATSEFQNATGTMLIGDHKIPESVIEDEQIDCGMNYSNQGQADALTIQELYRCMARMGTVYQPVPIDLMAVNFNDAGLLDMITEQSSGTTAINNWSRAITNRLIDTYIMKISAGDQREITTLTGSVDVSGRWTKNIASVLWLCLIYPQIIEVASYRRGIPDDVDRDIMKESTQLSLVPISTGGMSDSEVEFVNSMIKQSTSELASLGVRVTTEFDLGGQVLVQMAAGNLRSAQSKFIELLLQRTRRPMTEYLESRGSVDPADYFLYWNDVKSLVPALDLRDLIDYSN